MSNPRKPSSSKSMTPGALDALFDNAASTGLIGPASRSMLSGDLGAVVVAGAAGAALEDIVAAEVVLVTLLIDASSSIRFGGMEQAVREGHGALLDALAGTSQADSILAACWTFSDQRRVLHSYVPVGDATRLTRQNYQGNGGTTLYDAWCEGLAANVAYAQMLRDGGAPVRSVVVVVTDGEDCGSKRPTADCARLSRELLASEQFVLAFVGVGDESDFRKVAAAMGVPDDCVLVQQSADAAGVRRAFRMVSQSTIRASQRRVAPGAGAGFFAP